ncbi:hypothetical protein ACLOJK_036659 [Asimina triloba]
MVSSATYAATLHYQIAYRVQNHALDVIIPGLNHEQQDSLIIQVDDSKVPPPPVVTRTDPRFRRLQGDQVEVSFPKPKTEASTSSIFSTTAAEINMISYSPMEREPLPIQYFSHDGKPIYQATLDNGHKWYDIDYECQGCLDSIFEDEQPKKARRNINKELQHRYEEGDPTVGLLGEHSGRFDYYVLYPQSRKPSPPPQACHLISEDYEEDFPPLTAYQDMATRTSYRQTIPNPSPQKSATPAEACLNWSNTNAAAQNKILKKIEKKQDQAESRLQILQDLVRQIHERMGRIEAELYAIVQRSSDMAATAEIIRTKEKERKSLQFQLSSIQSEVHSLTSTPQPTPEAFPWTHKPKYNPSYQPQPLLPPSIVTQLTKPLFQEWRPKPMTMVAPMPKFTLILETGSVPATRQEPASQKEKQPMYQMNPTPEYVLDLTEGAFSRLPDDILPVEEPNPISSFLRATALREFDSDESEIDSEDPVYMADPGPSVQHPDEPMGEAFKPTVHPQQFQSESRLLKQPYFSLENVPPSQWKQLIDEWYSCYFFKVSNRAQKCEIYSTYLSMDFKAE